MSSKLFMRVALTISCLAFTSVFYSNCGKGFDLEPVDSALTPEADRDWARYIAAEKASFTSLPVPPSKWIFPNYALLPLGEAGREPFSMPERRGRIIEGEFTEAVPFFRSNSQHMYNPNVIHVPEDKTHPYRMYFFGWAKDVCNAHLSYHPENKLKTRPNYHWCDSIFLARAAKITGPWQVLEEDLVFRDNQMRSERWKPVVYSDNRDKIWDYHHSGDPSVIRVGKLYFMAYSVTGHGVDTLSEHDPKDTDGGLYSIAGAYSFDGLSWVKLKQPLLVTPEDLKHHPNNPPPAKNHNYRFHRPSLHYENGKFRLWFDYANARSVALDLGYAELVGEPTAETFSGGRWTIKQGRDKPGIANWMNPVVVKTPKGYFSYSDGFWPTGDDDGWKGRRIQEAFSSDGLTWVITGHLPHLKDCVAHAPEAIYSNGELHLLHHCIEGSAKDTMFVRKRKSLEVDDGRPKVCTPGHARECPVANGEGTQTCNDRGSGYGSCAVARCDDGYIRQKNSCIKKFCEASAEQRAYITTSLTYFAQARSLPQVSAIANRCHRTVTSGIELLKKEKWECSKTEVVRTNVQSCVQQLERGLKVTCRDNEQNVNGRCVACEADVATKTYLRNALPYLEGAVKVARVRVNAQACLTQLRRDLPALERDNWPCAYAKSTSDYISTCIEKVIKPAL